MKTPQMRFWKKVFSQLQEYLTHINSTVLRFQ